MIFHNWASFRAGFAESALRISTYTFADANPDTITCTDGSVDLVADGFAAGQTIEVCNSISNDGTYTANAVGGAGNRVITLRPSDSLTAEVATANVYVRGRNYDVDGIDIWPASYVRAGAFSGGFSGIDKPYTGAQMIITINALAYDSVWGVDDYDWYLSQRSDDPTRKYLDIAPAPRTASGTRSGTILVEHNALATAEYGTISTPSMALIHELFAYTYLYVQRRSDKAIQWVDLLRAMTETT